MCVIEYLVKSVKVTQSLKMVSLESMATVSYSHSIVPMVLSCIVYEIKWDIGRKLQFFHTSCIQCPYLGVPVGIVQYHLV